MTHYKPSVPSDRATVLQVIPDMEAGGAEKTVVDIGRSLVAAGWRSLVASQGGRLVAQLESEGSEHITLPLRSKNPFTLWRNKQYLQDLIVREGVDIIHARSRAPAWSAYGAARKTGIAFITTYHGAYSQTNTAKAFYNSVMGRADVIIANSKWTENLVAERYPEALSRIVCINRGTDFSSFAPDAISQERKQAVALQWGLAEKLEALCAKTGGEKPPVLLVLGRLTTLKGHELVIEAARLQKERNVLPLFVFAGDATGRETYHQRLIAQIEEAGLQDHFLLPGHCADPAAALALCDGLLSASTKAETFGRTVVEASALEKPVLASRIGAVVNSLVEAPEVERTGLLFQPSSADSLAQAITQFMEMPPQERHAMGQRGRAYVLPRFSLQAMCQQTLDVYKTRIDAKKRSIHD